MSIRPVLFHDNGDVDVVFDEGGHSGTVLAADVHWTTNIDGSHDHRFIMLTCPDGCGATSTHPVGGGAAPPDVQQMFVKKTARDGCACGVTEPDDSTGAPEAHARLNCSRMDGPDRWQVE